MMFGEDMSEAEREQFRAAMCERTAAWLEAAGQCASIRDGYCCTLDSGHSGEHVGGYLDDLHWE